MKAPQKVLGRQIFVLTPDEKRAAACVVGAFLLGLGTMHYRAKHPRPPLQPTAKEQQPVKRAATKKRPTTQATTSRAASPTAKPAKPQSRDSEDE